MIQAQRDLRKLASPAKASFMQNFFRTGPGEYGEGDVFLGLTVPQIRAIAKDHSTLAAKDLAQLLKSEIHDDRLLALVILVNQFRKTRDPKEKKRIFDFYLKNKSGVDNWDLVDTSAPQIVGAYCLSIGDPSALVKLSKSKRHWDKRIAMVGTFAYIRAGELSLTWKFAEKFLGETEDLMHKATGWMLREAGKHDAAALRKFIARHGKKMPRTMLRYSIEKFSPVERARILKSTR